MHFTNGYCDGCNHYIGWHNDDGCSGSYDCSTGVRTCEDAS